MQQTQKEVQVKPQKEMQVKPQKEVQVKPQKEIQVKPQKEVQVKPQKRCKKNSQFKKKNQLKTVSDSKPPVIEKQNQRKRKYEVFGKCVTAAAATTNKTKKNIKFQM